MPSNDRGRKNLTIKDSEVTSKEGPNINRTAGTIGGSGREARSQNRRRNKRENKNITP